MTIFTLLLQSITSTLIVAEEQTDKPAAKENFSSPAPQEPFVNFTGRVTRNKVRMRLQPSLDAPILRELLREDLLIVIGEADDFYAVKPPKDSKAYVFRTFVLDNKVEGNKVNVRLEPALEAPVIAQLNSGDEINGIISPVNSKWLEITPPASTRFYVCKEYVEKIGSPAVMAQIEKRREEVNELLNRSYQQSQNELEKNYETMNIDPIIAGYKKIIREYSDFSDQSARAKELLTALQETLLQRKIAYLEAKAANNTAPVAQIQQAAQPVTQPQKDSPPIDEPQKYHTEDLDPYTSALPVGAQKKPDWDKIFDTNSMTGKMAIWLPVEQGLYNSWAAQQNSPSLQAFYEQQMEDIVTLTGILEPYSRTVKNKPGDFLLVSSANSLPIAYLYSTNVNLQDMIGHVTTVHAVKRPNNNFAFPAYFVISME
jgi:hypothetical protein